MKQLAENLLDGVFSAAPWIAWLVITSLLVLSGPFGTYVDFSVQERTLYWGAVVALSVLSGTVVRVTVETLFADWSAWAAGLLTAAVLAVLLTYPLVQVTSLLSEDSGLRVPPWWELMLVVFVVACAVIGLKALVAQGEAPDERSQVPRILRRVDPELHGDIVRAEVADHYVMLVTDKGDCRLLMRFADALDELADVVGLQVHRSHWVADHAVTGKVCEKGRVFLETADGARVPVSRNYRASVEDRFKS